MNTDKKRAKEFKRKLKKAKAKTPDTEIPVDKILAVIKQSKSEVTATLSHPTSFTVRQKLVSEFFKFVYKDAIVIYGANDTGVRQAIIYFTDDKEFGPYMRGQNTGDSWDGVAEALMLQELDCNILPVLSSWKPKSQNIVNGFLARANKLFDFKGKALKKMDADELGSF